MKRGGKEKDKRRAARLEIILRIVQAGPTAVREANAMLPNVKESRGKRVISECLRKI